MMALTNEQLDKLMREDLLELLKRPLPLVEELEWLRQRVEELEAENERSKNRSANSRNSSNSQVREQLRVVYSRHTHARFTLREFIRSTK